MNHSICDFLRITHHTLRKLSRLFLFLAVVSSLLHAEEAAPKITIRLVTADREPTLVSDKEELYPVVKTVFDEGGTRTETIGERATLWVRNAHVDGKFFFERFYKGKYINRSARLEVDPQEFGTGEHFIQPGNHRFILNEDGTLSSNDPEIVIEGRTVSLRMHRISILPVDGSRGGTPEFRLVAANLGLYLLGPKMGIDPGDLPDREQAISDGPIDENLNAGTRLITMLSHARIFYPLHVYLPSNSVGQGYVLYPSWQAFQVTPDGKVKLDADEASVVPGITADGSRIVIPYRVFTGKAISKTGLRGAIGNVSLCCDWLTFSPTLESIRFTAGLGEPPEDFFLAVDNDLSKNPNKLFLADNTTKDSHAVRLLAMEWEHPVFESGQPVTVALRFMDTPGKTSVVKPVVRLSSSPYNHRNPSERKWRFFESAEWIDGKLTFNVPEVEFGYYLVRVAVHDADETTSVSPLSGEIFACVIQKGQTGTASFISNKGRNAFVRGEAIRLQAVLRSQSDRPPGKRSLVLEHPSGRRESFSFDDTGKAWLTIPLRIPGIKTKHFPTGSYLLTFEGLPETVAALPFEFDLVSSQPKSLYKIIKPSKYTRPMNDLVTSWLRGGTPYDLDRAVATLAELGYNRIDLMSYTTDLHIRGYTEREEIAGTDDRLMAPESVYTPSPRNQILNACVRHGIEFSDVLLSYNDFHLPRYIEGYIEASKRWIKREVTAMRHSPALAGMFLYDEMYSSAVSAFPDEQPHQFNRIRQERALKKFGRPFARIQKDFSRYLARPKAQRDPKALESFLGYRKWELDGWGDYNTRVADAARQIVPGAKIGTYHRTWMKPGDTTGVYNGYPPDLFKNLDLISCVHYADNLTGWVHSAIMGQVLGFGRKRPLFNNIPLSHEGRTRWDGQYQRHMAFAMLSQGADGISMYGLGHDFIDGPNPATTTAKETTRHLNNEILAPLGELISRTEPGYQQVGIVNTRNQHILSEFKKVPFSTQIEELWVACWRLGYPAMFLREEDFEKPLSRFKVIFVPGVRFDGELSSKIMERLAQAVQAGSRVVVEQGSELHIPGVIKLKDMPLSQFYVGLYFPSWHDDELEKVYEKSQKTTDTLAGLLPQWVEPTAKGPFKVSPNWRSSGSIHYLVMANFDDPDYNHTVKQIMAKPLRMPLRVPGHRGAAAYDLLSQEKLRLTREDDELLFELDVTRVQGGIVAFVPEPVGRLRIDVLRGRFDRTVKFEGRLYGERTGRPIEGVFPVRVRLMDTRGKELQKYFRVLGNDIEFELDLPANEQLKLEVRESIAGRTCEVELLGLGLLKDSIEIMDTSQPFVPYPREVSRFLAENKEVLILFGSGLPGLEGVGSSLVEGLKQKGIRATVRNEMEAFEYPSGIKGEIDPMADGFHSWRMNYEVIQPATKVDAPVILLGGKASSYLLEGLTVSGFLTEEPAGGPGRPVRPSIQLAPRGLYWKFDTLCLIANDAIQLKTLTERLMADVPIKEPPAPQKYREPKVVESSKTTPATPARAFLTNDEQIVDVKLDRNGNVFIITWGHGKNLYSLGPNGKLRFAKHLPEMGASRLDVFGDRILVYTSAGARLYQLTLDGKPISQARLDMDPGSISFRDGYSLSYASYQWLPATRQIVHNKDQMRIINKDGSIAAEWLGVEYRDKDVDDKTYRRGLRGFAFSPDGQRIAQIESTMYWAKRSTYEDRKIYDSHLVVRDLSGKLLGEYKNVANDEIAKVVWEKYSPGPAAVAGNEIWQFDDSLKLLYTKSYDPGLFSLGDGRRLVRDGHSLRYMKGLNEITRLGPLSALPTLASLSPDQTKIALLDEYGRLSLHEGETGKQVWLKTISQHALAMRFAPDSSAVVVGGLRGLVMKYNLKGEQLWEHRLSAHNDPGAPTKLYDASFPDFTEKLWPATRDKPGDLDKLAKMGRNRLNNGDCESKGGWYDDSAAYATEGYNSSRSLKVTKALVSQEITEYIGSHVTWVLELFYKSAAKGRTNRILAGLIVESRFPDSVGRTLAANDEWQFGRVVIKSGMNPRSLKVGFRAVEGEVLVDQISLRQIRFPSINHVFYEPLHEVEPIVLTNPLFAEDYNPVGSRRDEAPNRIIVEGIRSQVGPDVTHIEPAFLQNGRINDIGSTWYIQPLGHDTNISIGLKEPRWVSMVALYFNAYDEANVTPHFDIFAMDMETKQEPLVASIRHNRQPFRLVKFPPVKTPQINIRIVNAIRRLRTITEIEIYGPLSGKEGAPGFSDPEGQNTYMGSFARVDKRQKKLAEKYKSTHRRHNHSQDFTIMWGPPNTQILAAHDRLYVSKGFGFNETYDIGNLRQEKTRERSGALGFSPYVTLYGGLLLKPGIDGRLYCIDPDSGRALWKVKIGERLRGAPVAISEDIFAASDTGRLYKIDIANGSVMMEVGISGGVEGSMATDGKRLFVVSDDGLLQCYDAVSLKRTWSIDVSPHTVSTPAVDGGVVFCGDQQGVARSVDAGSGKVKWFTPLEEEFNGCPVVTERAVLYGCADGKLACLNRADGKLLWSLQTQTSFEYEPVVFGDKVLYFDSGKGMAANLSDGKTADLGIQIGDEPMAPISYYKGQIICVPRQGNFRHTSYQTNHPWHVVGGMFYVFSPQESEPAKPMKR